MNKPLIFIPYKRIGDLVFGMSRDEVREICGDCRFSRMYGYPNENRYLDDFEYMHGLYSSDLVLEAVELFPVTSLEYMGFYIYVGQNEKTLVEQLKKITDDLVYIDEDESYSSKMLGLMVYCPENNVEDVLIYTEHYFDEENEYIKNQEI